MIWGYVLQDDELVTVHTIAGIAGIYRPYFTTESAYADLYKEFYLGGLTIANLNAVLHTCRLFWQDQETHRTFYKASCQHLGSSSGAGGGNVQPVPETFIFNQHNDFSFEYLS